MQLLQWALPKLKLRWPGYRQVRKQVCKRIAARLKVLGLPDLIAYRAYLEHTVPEWGVLENLCHITISRFYRDRRVFEVLEREVLPALAEAARQRDEQRLACWSAGCASGEEPYTLRLLWELRLAARFPELGLSILATDADPQVIKRALVGCYRGSSLKELPAGWWEAAFVRCGDTYCLKPEYRCQVEFQLADIRSQMPSGPFHLILCRNLAFTYFEASTQKEVVEHLAERLYPGGALIMGAKEKLPQGVDELKPCSSAPGVFCR